MSTFKSPSGRYTLDVSSTDHWNSTGKVRAVSPDRPIAVIKRNYASFPLLWIEDYAGPDGIKHDYLVAGEDYQGQTVVELDTGKKKNFMPAAAKQGHGFCWAEMSFDPASKLITACGCVWACPYEFRLYDFSEPFDLREIEIKDEVSEDGYMDGDEPRWPEISLDIDGVVTVLHHQSAPSEDEDAEPMIPGPIAATKVYVREGLKLRCISELVTDAEKARRATNDAARTAYVAELKHWQATDELYLTFRGLADSLEKNKDHYDSSGITYDKWCPHWKGDERRWCRRIYGAQRGADGILHQETATTIDLEWATTTGPIKVTVWPLKDQDKSFDTWFEHSIDGMRKAFAFAATESQKDDPR